MTSSLAVISLPTVTIESMAAWLAGEVELVKQFPFEYYLSQHHALRIGVERMPSVDCLAPCGHAVLVASEDRIYTCRSCESEVCLSCWDGVSDKCDDCANPYDDRDS